MVVRAFGQKPILQLRGSTKEMLNLGIVIILPIKIRPKLLYAVVCCQHLDLLSIT